MPSTNGDSIVWKWSLFKVIGILVTVLGFIFVGYATWNAGEMDCIRADIRQKIDKEQYYRDIDSINKKLDGIDRKLDHIRRDEP